MNPVLSRPHPFRHLPSVSFRGLVCAGILLFHPRLSWGGEPVPSLPSAPSVYGLLWLDIDSDKAEIALDGLYLDQDVWLISIPPGDHEIRVRKAGFQAYESRFGISAGQNLHLDVHLEPASDSLARLPG